MTQGSTSATAGPDERLMRNALNPAVFADACRFLVANHDGHDLHRKLDMLVTSLLTSLGYGEGMEIFISRVAPDHGRCG